MGICWIPERVTYQLGMLQNAVAPSFFDLLESELDLVYDPLHCVALVLRHMVFHALYLWVQEHALDKLDRFHTLLSEHLEEWRAPVAEGPQHHEFSISCVSAKQVLKMKNCGMV